MQATVQTTDCWYSYTGYFVKIEPRILHMYGELFEYCCALYRLLLLLLLRVRSTATAGGQV